jgi:hypothetical protein
MPDTLKAGVEAMSGMSMDHVRVHRNSPKPAQLNAHAYAQGSDIHLAPGQEKHLPHEAWHVVQQAQGRVKPTMQMKGDVPVNDETHLEHEADVMGTKAAQLAIAPSLLEDMKVDVSGSPGSNSVTQKVVQRAGVKAELQEAENNFSVFMDESQLIDETRTEVANAIYNEYKKPKKNARDHFSDKVAHKGVNPNFDHGVAYEKARRLNHWTQNSIMASTRIYEELLGATQYNDDRGIGLEEITMGEDTTNEPDVYVRDQVAFESKHVDSASQGSVDGHITKCSEQLDSRKTNGPFNVAIVKWVAHIKISNSDNPWPYTPVSLRKAIKSGKVNVTNTALARIKKYENSSVLIRYEIRSDNPNIGNFDVKA